MKNLLIIGLMISILGGCVSRGEVKPSASAFNPMDLSYFSYLVKLDAENSLDNTEQYVETVTEANDNRQKTSASFFTRNEGLEQSELN